MDGDILIHEACFVSEETFDWGDAVTTDADWEHCRLTFEIRVNTIIEAVGFGVPIICLSDPSSRYFRHRLWPDYKGNRKGRASPVLKSQLRQWVESEYQCWSMDDLEADDVMGILGTNGEFDRSIIVTSDKDLLQIPGEHLNHKKLDNGVFVMSEVDGDQFHLYQTLVGDSTDNYPGCPGIGPKKAAKALEEHGFLWSTVVELFEAKGLTEEDALTQARLARILRSEDWNSELMEPRLWTPSV